MAKVLMFGISSDVKKLTPQIASESIRFSPSVFKDVLGEKLESLTYNSHIYLRGLNTKNTHFNKYWSSIKIGDVVVSFSKNRIMSVGTICGMERDPRFHEKMQHNDYTKQYGISAPSKQKSAANYEGLLFLKDLRLMDLPIKELKESLNEFNAWRGGRLFEDADQVSKILNYLDYIPEIYRAGSPLDDIKAIENDLCLKPTERERLIKARLGQGQYREDLLEYWKNSCSLTGINIPEMLIASHIKPWKASIDSDERLSKYNGLLLLPTIDRAFDQGLITFEDDGLIKISKNFIFAQKLGFEEGQRLSKTEGAHKKYLAYHREHIFKK